MKEWLKVFGLGFFNDRLAEKSAGYGFVSIVLSIVFSFVFFMFGFFAADVVPFGSHYRHAHSYREFVHNAVTAQQIEVVDGKGVCADIVNTYTSDADREKYAINGYDLIIDTRASDTLIEFSRIAVYGGKEISYDEYVGLSEADKANYTLKEIYTDSELVLSADRIEKFERYLDSISREGTDEYNAEAAAAYSKIKEENSSADEYGKEIYYLYVEYYYSGLESALMSAKAPVLCDYYYINYVLTDNDRYLYLFDNICIGSFVTDKGIPSVFTGYYKDCKADVLDAQTADGFIKDVFYSSVKYSMSSYFTGAMQMAPAYILIPVIVGLLMFLISKATKNTFGAKFGACYKVVNTFAWVSALLTGLTTFLLGFVTFARKLYLFMPLIFAVILILRTAVFYITRTIEERKTAEEQPNEEML